jgi:metal-responsive CopG/Arc/MetJ family transcriptional regulator
MVTLTIDEALDAELERVSTRKGRTKDEVVADVLRQYVQSEQRRQLQIDPALISLYNQLADEDIALAETGMNDYARHLAEADKA